MTCFWFTARPLLRGLALAAGLSCVAGGAWARDYTDLRDGTVLDPATGLQWMRCAQGQAWTGSDCQASAVRHTWAQATALRGTVRFAGHDDWRLPNVRELLSLVDRSAGNPAIDPLAFVGAPSAAFWSTTGQVQTPDSAWVVYFAYGNTYGETTDSGVGVRLVRGVPTSPPLMNPARPDADYTDGGDGTVTHGPTRLMWKRCAEGQSWSGSGCAGEARLYAWADAQAQAGAWAGYSDWRVPTAEELASLVDYSRPSPTINPSLFPSTTAARAWSVDVSGTGQAWTVNFDDGRLGTASRDDEATLRLVRSAVASGTLAADADRVFDWAERSYPQLFSPAGVRTDAATVPGYRLRAYAATGGYLGVNATGAPHLYYLGPASGQQLLDLGPLSDWLARVAP